MKTIDPRKPPYNCKSDGVTDDTAGFRDAMNTGLPMTLSPATEALIGSIRVGGTGNKFGKSRLPRWARNIRIAVFRLFKPHAIIGWNNRITECRAED